MSSPIGSELVSKEPPPQSNGTPSVTAVSVDSSADSLSGSDSGFSSSSSSPKKKKSKVNKKSGKNSESSESDNDSSSNSDSSFSEYTQSNVSSEPPGSFQTPVAEIKSVPIHDTPVLSTPLPGSSVITKFDMSANMEGVGDKLALPNGPVPQSPIASVQATATGQQPSTVASEPAALPPPLVPSTPLQGQPVQIIPAVAANVVLPVATTPAASIVSNTEVGLEVNFDQLGLKSPQLSDPNGGITSSSIVKRKSNKVSRAVKNSDKYKDSKYRLETLKLERRILRAEQGKSRKDKKKKKGGKQSNGPPKKRKKSKAATPPSSNDESSESSSESSDSFSSSSSATLVPGPSNRIARLPQGRVLQHCAMSRVKEQGFLKDLEAKLKELTDALSALDEMDLNIDPQLAYCFFHQVPGTGLPHMQPHILSFGEKYGALVKTIVKFHLNQMIRVLNEKKVLVVAEQNTPCWLWWQFQNDLARAPSKSTYMEPLVAGSVPDQTPSRKRPRSKQSVGKRTKASSKSTKKSKSSSKSGKRKSSGKAKKRSRDRKKTKKSKRSKKRSVSSS